MYPNFETIDIILAACLKVKGYKLTEILKHGNRGTFVFVDIPENILEDYDLGNALVEPKALSNAIRALTTAARR